MSNSKTKKVSSLIIVSAMIFNLFVAGISFAAESALDRVNNLIRDGRVPMYVRDKGTFTYDPNLKIVGIVGHNVNLRSQPNTKSNVIAQLSTEDSEKWPAYLGEWTHPNGEHWILGNYFEDGRTNAAYSRSWIVWIFGQFAQPMTIEAFNENFSDNVNYRDTPNDLPDDDDVTDVDVDVPSSSEISKQKSSSKKSSSKNDAKNEIKNVSSENDAKNFLEERLSALDKIAMNESLEFLSQTEINGENCWLFSAQFNFNETGRYAVSPSGKIYELDNEKFSLVQ